LRIRAIQEPVFSVANTDFEDGDDDHGYGDCIFLVIYAQPSHTWQKNAITATTPIATAFKSCIRHRKNGLRNRLPIEVRFWCF
jgi:hypothetical protein